MVRLPTWQCFRAGGNDSGGGGKGLSMVELGLWDKREEDDPLGTWQFQSPKVIHGVAVHVLVSYNSLTLAALALVAAKMVMVDGVSGGDNVHEMEMVTMVRRGRRWCGEGADGWWSEMGDGAGILKEGGVCVLV
ncbi:hypothetical protein Tco_0378336 [Tanacetum coccineum]